MRRFQYSLRGISTSRLAGKLLYLQLTLRNVRGVGRTQRIANLKGVRVSIKRGYRDKQNLNQVI